MNKQNILDEIQKTYIDRKDFDLLIESLNITAEKVRKTSEIKEAKRIEISAVFESIAVVLLLKITNQNQKNGIQKKQTEKLRK